MAQPLVTLTPREKRALLSRIELLAGGSDEALDTLATAAELHEVGGGEVVVRQGTEADAMYVLVHGVAEVRLDGPNADEGTVLGVLETGALFGELAMLTDELRTATVRAIEPLIILAIPRRSLLEVLQHHPDLAQEVWTTVARRRLESLLAASHRFAAQPDLARRLLALAIRPAFVPAHTGLSVQATGSLFIVAGQVELQGEAGWQTVRGPSILPALGPVRCEARTDAVIATGPPVGGLSPG